MPGWQDHSHLWCCLWGEAVYQGRSWIYKGPFWSGKQYVLYFMPFDNFHLRLLTALHQSEVQPRWRLQNVYPATNLGLDKAVRNMLSLFCKIYDSIFLVPGEVIMEMWASDLITLNTRWSYCIWSGMGTWTKGCIQTPSNCWYYQSSIFHIQSFNWLPVCW